MIRALIEKQALRFAQGVWNFEGRSDSRTPGLELCYRTLLLEYFLYSAIMVGTQLVKLCRLRRKRTRGSTPAREERRR